MFSLKIQPVLQAVLLAALAYGASLASAQASNMVTGGLTSQPIGHYDFCKKNPSECMIRSRDLGPERMSDALWKQINRVNLAVNAAVKPMSDMEIYGKPEVWAYPDAGVGDCEDYALEKRRTLMRQGISVSNLLITVLRKPDGEGHAVLTLRTDKGDMILDNLSDEVKVWDQTGYNFLKRQSSTHTGRWVTIREGQTPLVAAVK